jgi:hypothetical protein
MPSKDAGTYAPSNPNPGLPNLGASQYEDNQLILYGGWLLGSNGNYFWVPNSTFTGWVKNTSAPGYSYVNTIRNDVQTCS